MAQHYTIVVYRNICRTDSVAICVPSEVLKGGLTLTDSHTISGSFFPV